MLLSDGIPTSTTAAAAAVRGGGGGRGRGGGVLSVEFVPYYRSILRSCARGNATPSVAYSLHGAAVKSGLLLLLSTPLLHMYAALRPAPASHLLLRAFDDIPGPVRSAPEWTALISALPPSSHSILLFRSMLRAAVRPDAVSLLALLSASARLADPVAGASAHLLFLKLGTPFSVPARNAALHMYAACGRMPDARRLFDEMPQPPTVVAWTALLAGALRWEGLSNGREIFDKMPHKNDVSWTVMVTACIESGLPREALSLLAQMLFRSDDCFLVIRNLNHISLCSLLSACSQAGDLRVGRWIHAHLTKAGAMLDDKDNDLYKVATSLVDMYGKSGRIDVARRVFEMMHSRNVVAWNALLSGLSMHGMGTEVLTLFDRMVVDEAQQPDEITFVNVLSACSRSGLVDQGRKIFYDLQPVYGLVPKLEHYACMVDLLGRAGQLEEAEALVRQMPLQPNVVILGSLLASCGIHGRLELGQHFMNELMQIDSHNTEYHMLLSNMYTSSGSHAKAANLRMAIKKNGIRKSPGLSYIEIDGHVHRFNAGDKSHPRAEEVYAMLDEVVRKLQSVGYIPDAASQVSFVPDCYVENGDEREEREQALLAHSERLAICFGLISTSPGMPLRIFKNLRICSDCHVAIKLISGIYKRVIFIRDRNRFHCFKEGACSCSDYW
ncbi:pentatricopeptide repeat-containing protein [Canna indica]|uniref:Pentatricopeptide repeat-containing protein n=1 Tax=Canna indica TaxID=4628 RepID=A0AAQ3KWD7_9LILI|nr:pentatricopeptide repeat-containing protein [Canna indica]